MASYKKLQEKEKKIMLFIRKLSFKQYIPKQFFNDQ